MSDLQIFHHDDFGQIRTTMIEEEPWFVGKDVAEALGYTNPRKAIIDHVDDDDKGVTNRDTLGGTQQMTILNESGLYSLIFGSRLESAKRFKRWVTSEVLPSIRKTGSYSTNSTQLDYLQAAKLIASCKPDRLPFVLSLLKSAGFVLPEPQHTDVSSVVATRGIPFYSRPDVTLNTEIASLMAANRVSLRELSRRTGIPVSSLNYYARGLHRPTSERYNLIIDVLSK